ncbi:hypothetical protein SprV_0200668000 [Sparganum proliferum]
MCDSGLRYHGASSPVAWKAADWRPNTIHAVLPVACVCVCARKAEEIQGYADRNEWKNFFSAVKSVYGPPTKGTAPLLNAEGNTLLTERTHILQRWDEHFRGVLKRAPTISDAAIAHLPQVETNVDLDLPPSLQETVMAVQRLSSEKAP